MKIRNICALVAIGITVGTSVHADKVMKFGLSAPEKTPWAANAHDISKSVESGTNGSIKIQVFSGSQLGNEQDVIRQVSRGRIQMGSFSNTAASLIVPEIALLAAPYLWDSVAQADCVLDNHMIEVYQQKFREKGLVILGWSEVGQMGYAFTDPIEDTAGLSGKKMRVAPTKASSITAKAYGANAIPLPITEVASALQTGLVEGADLPTLAFTSLGFGKIAKNWLKTDHSHQVGVILMSEKVWSTLSKSEQEQFKSAQISLNLLRQQVRGAEAFTLGKFVEAGGKIVNLTEDDLTLWRAKGAGARQELVKELGGEASQIYSKILKAKKTCDQP